MSERQKNESAKDALFEKWSGLLRRFAAGVPGTLILPPADPYRVETGAVAFGNDWPGVFIRGDNALHWAHCVRRVIDLVERDDERLALESLATCLELCRVDATDDGDAE